MDYLLEGEESDRLQFRKLTATDIELWLPFHEDPTILGFWADDVLPPKTACAQWFEKAYYRYENGLGGMNALIDKTNLTFVGQCGLLTQEVDGVQELEIGYSLLPLYRNKGYATEAAKKCKSVAFERNLAQSLISIIHIKNKASQNVAIRNGMFLDKTTSYKDNPVHIFRIYSP